VEPVPLHVLSRFMRPTDIEAKTRAIELYLGRAWTWATDGSMPDLPASQARSKMRVGEDV
jgi:hypothetical protein